MTRNKAKDASPASTRAEQRLAVQYAVSRVLIEAMTLAEAAPRLLQVIGQGIGWPVGLFWSVDRTATALNCLATWHAPTVSPTFDTQSCDTTFPPGTGVPGRVWAGGAATWVPDVLNDPNFPRASLAREAGLQSAFAFPARGGQRILAVLEFFSQARRPLDEDLLEAVTMLGHQIGQFMVRTEAEAALRASEARNGAIVAAALDCIITMDHQGAIIEFNPAAEQTFGYRREEVIGQEMACLIIPPALREAHRQGLARYLATSEGQVLGKRLELTALRADGTEFPIELTITRLPSSDHPVFTGFVRDIMARKRQEERQRFLTEASSALAESLDYQVTLANIARLAVPFLADFCLVDILNEDGSICRVAAAHADPAKEELVRGLLTYPPRLDGTTSIPRVLQSGQPVLTTSMTKEYIDRLAHDAEHHRLIEALAPRSSLVVPLRAHGRTLGTLSFITAESGHHYGREDLALAGDLADRCALAIDNAGLYHDAQAAIRVRDEFLAIAAHELKTPLTVIKGYGQLLARQLSQPIPTWEQLVYLSDQHQHQVARFEILINDLLDISRLQRGRLDLRRETVELTELGRQVLERFAHAPERTSHHTLVLEAPEPVIGHYDSARLDQILTNLLSNALKYSPAGGEVRLRVRQQGEQIEIAVKDEGIGMSAATQAMLFQPFVRGEADQHNIQGVGLGLYIVAEVVKQHGGTITVQSARGAGSTFTVLLPAVSPSEDVD